MINIIDVFAGAGGLSEGFRQEQFNVLLHVEMNHDATLTLKTREAFYYLRSQGKLNSYANYLNGTISRDQLYNMIPEELFSKVLNVEINEDTIDTIFNRIDSNLNKKKLHGIIGGPPCQAFSMIGRVVNESKKPEDKRIYLYEYYVKFLQKYQPEFFVFENVKGLLSFKNDKDELLLPIILKAFSDQGYSVSNDIVNSSEYGVPQNRERLFVFGYRKDLNYDDFFKSLSTRKEVPIKIKDLFSDLPSMKPGESKNEYIINTKSDYLRSKIRKYLDFPLTANISRTHNDRDLKIYKLVLESKKKGKQLRYDELPNTLKTHKNTTAFIDRFKALDENGYSHTIVAHIAKDGHYYIHPDLEQNRSITVREAARIQTFADDYYFEGSRSANFVQIGNAVPPVLSEKIAATILDVKEAAK